MVTAMPMSASSRWTSCAARSQSVYPFAVEIAKVKGSPSGVSMVVPSWRNPAVSNAATAASTSRPMIPRSGRSGFSRSAWLGSSMPDWLAASM